MKLRKIKIQKLLLFARNDAGGTLAELAILAPLLLVLLAAVSEFGRYFETYTTLAKATRSATRYLSNHPLTTGEKDKAKNLVRCGKLANCAANDRLVPGIETSNVCIETTGSPIVETVTVRIPRTADGCGAPLNYRPIFNIGALLHSSFNLAVPISPRTTMRYVLQ
jgi:Flp pilus assembly protein TadG